MHRSHHARALDRLAALLGARIRRCHDCRSRCAWFGSMPVPFGGDAPGLLRQIALAAGGFLLCMLLLWWMLGRFSAISG